MTTAVNAETTSATLFGSPVRLYDLSQVLSKDSQVHPDHPPVGIHPYEWHEHSLVSRGTGFSISTKLLIMSDHAGTHVDAMSHMDPDPSAPSIDQMPLNTFCGDAICLDLSHKAPRSGITVADLEAALAAAGSDIEQESILILYTGHYERTGGTPAYLTDYPGLDPEAAEWMFANGVTLFGAQAPSVDRPDRDDYPVHVVSRPAGVTHIENIGRLEPLAGKRFTLFGFPLRIAPGTASPIRLVGAIADR